MTKAASDERSAIFDLCELPLCPKEEDEKGFFFFSRRSGLTFSRRQERCRLSPLARVFRQKTPV